MFSRIYQYYSKKAVSMTLFQKLASVFILVALIPLVIMQVLFFRSAESIIFKETVNSDHRALSQTATILNNDFISNQNALTTLVSIPEVVHILAADQEELTVFEQAMDLRELLDYANIVNTTESVYKLRLFVRDDLFYSGESVNTFAISTIEDEWWYPDVIRYPYVYIPTREQQYLLLISRKVISLAMGIRDYIGDNQLVGVAMADIDLNWVEGILSENVTPSDNAMCIMDESGNIIAQSGSVLSLKLPREDEFQRQIVTRLAASDGVQAGRYNDWYVNWTSLEVPGWHLVELIPAAKMGEGKQTLFIQMMMVTGPIVALIIILTLYFSRVLSDRVKVMDQAVRKYSDGDTGTRLLVTSDDVIGRLQHRINQLFERMNKLMDERYELGQQAKHADLNALQSQINPHFLYNTLDMLYWMAKGGEHEDLPRIIMSLSGFYRKSLAQGRDVVTVRDEIEHVQYYIDIQNKRYNDVIKTRWDIDDTLLDYPIMKLLMQPIVENAIQHGLIKSEKKGGTITIGIRREDEHMQITIADDGAGMTHQQIHDLLSGKELTRQQDSGHGYGVSNVEHRIKIFYGDQYGLSYESVLGHGTTVRMTLPLTDGSDRQQ